MKLPPIQMVRSIIRSGHVFDRIEKNILVGIAICGDRGSGAFPSINELASNASASRRSVQQAIQRLVALGVLEIIEPGGGRKSHRYKINGEKIEQIAAAVFRAKSKAREDRADPHQAMRRASQQIRSDLIEKANFEPSRGPLWRSQFRRQVAKQDAARESRRLKSS